MSTLVTQAGPTPTRKVTAGVVGGTGLGLPIGQLIVWGLSMAGLEVSPEVATAIGTLSGALVGFVSAWLARERAE